MKNWSKYLATAIVIGFLIMAVAGSIIFARAHEEGPWIDTTDLVSEQSAMTVGRQALGPLINTDQGNMLVFFFTLAGILAGLVIGYYWSKLMTDRNKLERKRLDMMFIFGVILTLSLLILAWHEAFSSNPFINPDLGDVKLFTFISLGTILGFMAGFNTRPLDIWNEREGVKTKN
jgi:cobalt/nickel transport protein